MRWLLDYVREKESDVALAVSLVADGVRGLFDAALIVSADSDMVPPSASWEPTNLLLHTCTEHGEELAGGQRREPSAGSAARAREGK